METDRVSIEKTIAGDARAFKKIVDDHQKLVAHIVFRMVSNPTDRQEVCQEVFIKVFENLKSFRYDSKLSTWIARIAYNMTLNFLQKKKISLYGDQERFSEEEGEAESAESKFSENIWGGESTPDEVLVSKEMKESLRQAIEELPPQYRTLITLYHLDEMSYLEIGQIMNLPEGTVKSYIFRARKLLKEALLAKLHGEAL